MYAEACRYRASWFVVSMCALLCGCSVRGGEQIPAPGVQLNELNIVLDRRMESFVAAFDSIGAEDFVEFFPRSGEVVYRHTRHTPKRDEVLTKTFRAVEIPSALQYEGPLWPSFEIQFEGQPIGLLAHQVMERPGRWSRVSGSRFVPPGEDSLSPTYVEWRMEGPRWVISAMADESFVGVPLPDWVRRN